MSTHALQTAAAGEVEARDSVTLEILVKALMAGSATVLTASLGAKAAVLAAVLATCAAEGVRQFVKRRNWGVRRVGFLVALTVALSQVDSLVARGAYKAPGGSHLLDAVAQGAGQIVLTTTAAAALTVTAVTVPELATGKSLLSDRESTFFSEQPAEPSTPGATTNTPGTKPHTPGTKPDTPGTKPGTQPGTSGHSESPFRKTFWIGRGKVGRLTFPGEVGERVFVRVTGSTISTADLRLYGAGDEVLASSVVHSGDSYLDTRRLPRSGSHSVRLDPWSTHSGRATVAVVGVAPDPVETVALRQAGRSATMSVSLGQALQLRFAGDAGERVFVRVTGSTITTADLRLYGVGDEVLASSVVHAGDSYLDTQRLPADGSYSVRLDPWGTYSGRATVVVVEVAPDPVETVVSSEAGRSATMSVSLGQALQLRFAGEAGERVFVRVTGSTITTADLRLYGVGDEVLASSVVHAGDSHLDTERLPADGSYSVRLDPWGTYSGRAKVTVVEVAPDPVETVVLSEPGRSATMSASLGQAVQLNFAGRAGERVSVRVTGSTITTANLGLYGVGDEVLASKAVGSGDSYLDTRRLPASGSYSVRLDPWDTHSGRATVTVTKHGPD